MQLQPQPGSSDRDACGCNPDVQRDADGDALATCAIADRYRPAGGVRIERRFRFASCAGAPRFG
jgi:hypothetical protein